MSHISNSYAPAVPSGSGRLNNTNGGIEPRDPAIGWDLLQELTDYYNSELLDKADELLPSQRTVENKEVGPGMKVESSPVDMMTPSTSYGSDKSSRGSGDSLTLPGQDLRGHHELNVDAPEFVPEGFMEESGMNPDAPEFVPATYDTVDSSYEDDQITRAAEMTLQYQIDRVKEQLNILVQRLSEEGIQL
ncbi:hypothetical protein FOL47_006837 [Perkinsus chesapeaki]|uniref:Uncharacterized protein n=2 Tax=Alveolata TaxID=33630 RepID=A0A7J6LQ27_PERCH|nr:hypothetical protein FOL47_006837 [Perkinsus chesapeaki]